MTKDFRSSIILWLASIAVVCTFTFDLLPDFDFFPSHESAPWLMPTTLAVLVIVCTVDLVGSLRRQKRKDRGDQ